MNVRRTHIAAPTAVLLAFVLGACGDSEAEPAETVVRDSAGVHIVESGAAAPRELVLNAEPILTIGEMEGAEEYELHNVNHATRLSDGTLVVSNGGSGELRFYDPAGRHVRSAGRRGSGPGEFEAISYLRRLAGDTLLVYDARNRRVTLFGSDGTYVRDFTPEGPGGQVVSGVEGAAADGTLLVLGERNFPTSNPDVHRDTMKFGILRGDSLIALREYRGREMSIRTESSGGEIQMIMIMEVAYGRSTMSSAADDRFYIASNDTYEIHSYDLDGNLQGIIRSAHIPVRPVDNAAFAEYFESALEQRRRFSEQQGTEFDLAEATKSIEESPRAPSIPVFGGLRADQDGGVWVRDYTLAARRDEPARWTVFDADGAIRGAVVLPARFQPLHIAGDTLTGVITDEYDVEYVHVYTLGG